MADAFMTSGKYRHQPPMIIRLIFVSVLILAPRAFGVGDSTPTKNVLVMYSFADRNISESVNFLKSQLRSQVGFPINFYVEYLETQRFEDSGYEESAAEALHNV